MTTLLLVAAESREFAGLLRRCRQVRRLAWPVRFARSGLLNGSRLLMVAHGPGKLAEQAVAAALARERPDAVLSTGWCGALDPALDCGDIFVAERVAGFAVTPPATARPFRSGLLLSADRVVSSTGEKQRLHAAEGAAAVEMEAAGVARRAAGTGLPFYCIRVVMDRADQGFVLDFNSLRDDDGRFSRARILRAALRRPRRCLPELLRLERQGRRAARALGDFLADCRF